MENNEKHTITSFLNENYRILTLLGVFGGLITLFMVLQAIILAFICFLIIFLLAWEVLSTMPRLRESSKRLIAFNLLLLLLLISLFLLIIYKFNLYMQYFSYVIIWVALSFIYILIPAGFIPPISKKYNITLSKKLHDFLVFLLLLFCGVCALFTIILYIDIVNEFINTGVHVLDFYFFNESIINGY